MDSKVEHLKAQAIRKVSRGKAPVPNGIPMEPYKMCPELFAAAFCERMAACGRHACVIPGWDTSILIPVLNPRN